MTSREFPNYNAIDEAVAVEHAIRGAYFVIGVIIVAIVHIVRWAWHVSPVIGG